MAVIFSAVLLSTMDLDATVTASCRTVLFPIVWIRYVSFGRLTIGKLSADMFLNSSIVRVPPNTFKAYLSGALVTRPSSPVICFLIVTMFIHTIPPCVVP